MILMVNWFFLSKGATVVLMRMPEVQKSTNVEQPKMPILCIQLGLTKINKSDMKELKCVRELPLCLNSVIGKGLTAVASVRGNMHSQRYEF
jgi:hypothetical protein